MKPWRFGIHRLDALCPDCEAKVSRLTTSAADGALILDLDAEAGRDAFKLAARGCDHPKPAERPPRRFPRTKELPRTIRVLCPYRVTEWKTQRGDGRWEMLRGLRVKGPGWRIDMDDERVKAFLAEEGDAAKVLLARCP
jgi:hypothetical protein